MMMTGIGTPMTQSRTERMQSLPIHNANERAGGKFP